MGKSINLSLKKQSIVSLLILFLFVTACSSWTQPSENTKRTIVKSVNDKRNYKALKLSNQLEVLLISDPSTDQAAAALDVRVGQFDDPSDRQGLAHFLEHMLFLGNEKFPEPNGFSQFLSANGGSSNAYTSLEETNYFFSVHKDQLESSLDQFSQFFISPTFYADFVNREVKAVNSEHLKNIKTDGRRIYQLLRSISNPLHPFHKFGTGNTATLLGEGLQAPDIHTQVVKFYHDQYSANLMKLVILGKEPLADLERFARTYFTSIKNKSLKKKSYDQIPVVASSLKRKIVVEPIKSIRQFRLMFPIPPQRDNYLNKPAGLLAFLIGDESNGSILSSLKKQGWATSLSAGIGPEATGFAFFSINIGLTPKGMEHTDEIARLVFQYIKLIKESESLERYFTESKRMAEINFQFLDKQNPYWYVSKIASQLQSVPSHHAIAANILYEEYRQDLIDSILQQLHPENLQILLVANNLPVNKTEKWYQTRYGISPLNQTSINQWKNPGTNTDLHLPVANPFIPEKISLKILNRKSTNPTLIKHRPGLRVWFKQDDVFRTPKGNLHIQLSSPRAYTTVKKAAMTKLFTKLLKEKLNEFTYPASLAGLNYSVYNTVEGINLSLGGYSENIQMMFQEILKNMVSLKIDPELFLVFRDEILEKRQNQKFSQAFQRVGYEMNYLLSTPLWHTDEYIRSIGSITVSDLESFLPELLDQLQIEFFAHGNFNEEEVLNLSGLLEKQFHKSNQKPLMETVQQTINIPSSKQYVYQISVEDLNSAIYSFYQVGPKSTEQTVALDMLQQVLEKPFYSQLRTLEQLGYLVWSGYQVVNKVEGLYFVIQSNSKDPVYLESRIVHFLAGFKKTLANLSEKEFDQFRRALITKRLEKPKNLQEETQQFWAIISSKSFDFNHRQKEIAALKNLKLSDIKKLYQKVVISSATVKKLTVQGAGKNHEKFVPMGIQIDNPQIFRKKIATYENPDGDIELNKGRDN